MTAPRTQLPQGVRVGIRYEWDPETETMVPVAQQPNYFGWKNYALLGGLPIIGGVLQSILQNRQAEKQMRFQREMSNTAYSRAAKDMRAAGINPLLGFQGPASTPQGAQAQIGIPLAEGVSSAIAARQSDIAAGRLALEALNATAKRRQLIAAANLADKTADLTAARTTSAQQQAAFDLMLGELGPAARLLIAFLQSLK